MTGPSHRALIGPWLPSWALSLLSTVIAVAAVAALRPLVPWLVVVVVCAALGAQFPRSLLAWAPILVLTVAVLAGEPDPLRTAIGVFAVHVIHVCATLAHTFPARTRIAVRALRATGVRFLAIQLTAQAVAFALGVSLGQVSMAVPGAAIAAAAAVAGFAIAVVWRVGRRQP